MPVECFPWQVHLSWIGRGWQAILGSVPGDTCVSEDLRHWSVTPGRSTQAGLVEGDRSYWGQSLVSLCVWRPMPVECYSWQVHPSWIGRGWQAILGSVPGEACETDDPCQWCVTPGRSTKARLVEGDRPYWGQSLVKPVCLKTYASRVLSLAGPPKLDWSRVTSHTRVSPWWNLCVWRPMPVKCYSWQVHPSWISRGWQAILGSVPGEACVSEDLCQWSVTPGRYTKAGLVEGDRPYWGQSLVKPVCLKTYASGVLSLAGPHKLDWSRVTGHTGVSPWWSLCVWRPMQVKSYPWPVHQSWIGRGWQVILGSIPSEACVSEDLCQWSITPGRSTQAGLVEGDRPYWGQSLVKPVRLKTYASEELPLAGPPKLDWSRVTGHTRVSPWWSLCVWRTMPVECYSWQVHPSWIGRGGQAILGSVPGEAECLKTYVSGVLPLEGPPKPDWSKVTGHTGESPWWSLCVWRPMPVACYFWEVHLSWIGRGWQARLGIVADPPGWGFSMGPTNPSLHRFPPGQSPLENEDFAVEEEFDDTGRWRWPKVNLNLKS